MIVALCALQEHDRQKTLAAPLAEVRSTLPLQTESGGKLNWMDRAPNCKKKHV